jgi:glycosyltransferase involved in cell wall biosynthesis
MLAASGGGVAVPPDDPEAFCTALSALLEDPDHAADLGRAGRAWVEHAASPAAVAAAYERLIRSLDRRA